LNFRLGFVNLPRQEVRVALTRRQREVLDFVTGFIATHGYSPSLEEIGEHFGLSSVATVHKHVQHLVEKGYLRKAWNRSRSVEPMAGSEAASLPLLGQVAAGRPIEAIEASETISVPREMLGRAGDCFVLRVRGDSMLGDQIRDGDYVVVESTPEARDGEMVVALIRGEEATLKRLERRGRTVRLVPSNPAMEPIELPARDVAVRGVVRGLLRHYGAAAARPR
jgi:repressor LexA